MLDTLNVLELTNNNERVVLKIMRLYELSYTNPLARAHVAGIEQRQHLVQRKARHIGTLQLAHFNQPFSQET